MTNKLMRGWEDLADNLLVELKNTLDFWAQHGVVVEIYNDPLCKLNPGCVNCPADIVGLGERALCNMLEYGEISLDDLYELVEHEMSKRGINV